ncbi:hypothetical protein GQ44DRAFT_56509 [Phaeosphaeriaceae sp. PMI808]|nr:hypothetical protein GQ44DRAFT_56509 [Phaeosphaeriaceae sp. PMI808]
MPSVCEAIRSRDDAVQPRAGRGGTSQTLPVGDGLTRKPISDCLLRILAAYKEFGLRRCPRIAVSRLDGCCCVPQTCYVVQLARKFCRTVPAAAITAALQDRIGAEGCAMACRDRCGRVQMYFDAFVMGFPKIEFSLFVVFFRGSGQGPRSS